MTAAALFDGFSSDNADAWDTDVDGLDVDDAGEGADDLFAGDVDDASDEWDALDAGDEYDLDGLNDADDLDLLSDDVDDTDDALDEMGDFAYDAGSGLFVPQAPRLISGQAALAIARQLNPAVLQSMDADDAEAFFRRIGGAVRRAARGLRRAGGAIGRGLRTVGRVAGPLIRRALPMIQRVAGFAGPWGRLISAGIGAAQGLMEGRGLRGALAGAVGGLIPGVGGRLASSVLGGDGADDDAAIDALADMADTGEVDAAVALPAGAGLAARLAVRRGLGVGPGHVPGGVMPSDRGVWRQARAAERILLASTRAARGSAGRQLRVMRAIARLASSLIQRRQAESGPAAAARAVPAAVSAASRRVIAGVRRAPAAGTSTPQQASRRNAARRRLLSRVPMSLDFRGRGPVAVGAA